MRKAFYSRLALLNIRKNKTIYVPYLLSGALIVALHYILGSVAVMARDSGMKGGGHMYEMLSVSANVCGILSLIVLLYINSFVMKRRKKEFGLYSILGMGKRHISLVILWEVLLTALISIAGGILGGALMSQLLFLALMGLVKAPVSLTFQIPLGNVLSTALLFGAGFAFVLAANIASVGRSSAAVLIRGDKVGEREPKARWLLAALGAATLLAGYGMAWTARSPADALMRFFPAVLLVIAGTFLLFITGSIALLKLLRKNKRFYYKPGNFIAVSGMLYRMKQNAAGLANICILSTCVLVTASSTVCLFLGEEDLLQSKFPRQIHVSCASQEDSPARMLQTAKQHAARNAFAVENAQGFYNMQFPVQLEDGRFEPKPLYDNNTYRLTCITLADYNAMTGEQRTLNAGEALLAGPLMQELPIADALRYTVKGEAQVPALLTLGDMSNQMVAVLPGLEDLLAVNAQSNAAENSRPQKVWYDLWYDVTGDPAGLDAFYDSMRAFYEAAVPQAGYVDTIDAARNDFYQIYGSLLFIGIFFVSLFLIATVLIIYYKQITEGFDDHDRFQIMEKVGMSSQEIRSTIHRQVLMVFFLPLGMAAVHIAAAFRSLCQLLLMFDMDNTGLFVACVAGALAIFSLFYFVVYRLTARAYFRIVY